MADELMNEGGGTATAEQITQRLEALLDLAADRYIEEDPQRVIFTEPGQPYRELLGTAAQWGRATTDPVALRVYLLEQQYAVEYANDTIVFDMPDGRVVTYYLRGGKAWRGIRTYFEGVRPLAETVLSYTQDGFAGPITLARRMKEGLTPVPDFPDHIDALTSESMDTEKFALAVGKVNPGWEQGRLALDALEDWEGEAALAFKGTCLYRLPAILTGQTVVASVLTDALVITAEAYRNLRAQAQTLIEDAIGVLAFYPARVSAGEKADWSRILGMISGVAAMITLDTALIPAVNFTLGAAAALVSGGAALAGAIIGAPANPEVLKAPPQVTGSTVMEIMANFEATMRKYLDVVDNTERTLARVITDFDGYVREPGPGLALVPQTFGRDIMLTRHEAFFEVKRPKLADLGGASLTTLDDYDSMGPAPHTGDMFGIDAEKALKAGHLRLPELADRFFGLAGTGADHGVDTAFGRTEFGSVPGQTHDYRATGRGALFPAWTALYQTLVGVLRGSGEALMESGEALVLITRAYLAADQIAAEKLSKETNYPGDMP